ncbi:SIMPL domain-containing protein [Shewanella profunda]|uniref:SIMPL domain-containing protein n=1 Tax=Shewanella profunda TaxID=254793 RepID=UPI0020105556|nr:SIMPL domain-containing protein [Shewanella profunda]MCL1091364.1 SIMPL domain-containing protein [Shewanella profunda]
MKFLSIITLLVIPFLSFANSSLPNNRHIAIVGSAQLEAKPDIAVIYLKVESLKAESVDAKLDVDERVNNFLDGLAKFNVNEENVSASSISTEPHYSYSKDDKEELDGYTAHRNLKVTLNDIQNINSFVNFALDVKINEIRNIELRSSKAETLQKEVIALAVKNAKENGNSYAQAFDAKLGKIYSINSAENQSYDRYGANDYIEKIVVTGSRLGKPAQPGKYLQENIVFSASINVVFDLEVK